MKGRLLSGVAAVAFGMGMVATGPALAGGSVTDWDWYKNKYQNVDINMWVWSFFDPTGETEVKKVQIFLGDVEAYAELKGDYVPEVQGGHHGHHGFGGYTQDLLQYANDGLGHAVQDVSAIGIVDSIESEFPVYAYETQILSGAADLGEVSVLDGVGSFFLNFFEKAEISAEAKAGSWYNPVEIAVDQQVSAVAAALSIDLQTLEAPQLIQTNNADHWDSSLDTGDTIVTGHHDKDYGVFMPYVSNNILEADITQFAYADVSASATAYQDLTNFKQLGYYDRLGTPGLVANQSVQAAGLVASIVNKVKEVTP